MNILAIGAHPDDIEFGCGGTLLKYAQKGYSVYLLILTQGSVGGQPGVRSSEQEKAAEFMKIKKIFWGGFKDTEVPLTKESISVVENAIIEVQPDVAFFNYGDDSHQDHRIANMVCISATRYIKEVFCFEVPSSQNFQPDVFVDIGDILSQKMELLKLHFSQVDRTKVENLTILESAEACALFRGYQGRVKYAEGFKAVRMIKEI